jgi:AraC-like DNA-binding protein
LLQEKDIVLINSKEVHGFQNNNQENICLIIQVKNEFFNIGNDKNQTYHFYLNSAKEIVKPKIAYEHFKKILSQIGLESFDLTKTSSLRLKGFIYQFAADLLDYVPYDIQQYTNESVQNDDSDDLLKIIYFVEENYCSENNITDGLCKSIGMSEKSLYRFLKSKINMTLKELIDLTRMNRALYLLAYTEKDNSIIAQECGFGNDNTFYRSFKKFFGMTPQAYKNMGNKDKKSSRIEGIQGYLDFNRREALQLLRKQLQS